MYITQICTSFWKIVSCRNVFFFLPIFLWILMCKYFNCEYININIYIFVPEDLLQCHGSERSIWQWAQRAGGSIFSLCQALIFIFGCKFYENLFAVWGESIIIEIRQGTSVKLAFIPCLFIIPQMYGKKIMEKIKDFFFSCLVL